LVLPNAGENKAESTKAIGIDSATSASGPVPERRGRVRRIESSEWSVLGEWAEESWAIAFEHEEAARDLLTRSLLLRSEAHERQIERDDAERHALLAAVAETKRPVRQPVEANDWELHRS
jgi:hypothetical protein